MTEDKWRDDAACKDYPNPELFFVDDREDGVMSTREAKAICRGCPVKNECFTYAYENRIPHGVFGGVSGDDRRLMWRRAAQRALRDARKERAA